MSINRLDIHFETNKILWDIKCHWFESKCLKFPRNFIHPNFNSLHIHPNAMQSATTEDPDIPALHCWKTTVWFGFLTDKGMTWHNLVHRRHCLKGITFMVFHSVLLEVSIIWKYVIAEVTFVQHSAEWCIVVDRREDGERQKSGNLGQSERHKKWKKLTEDRR